MHASIDMNQRDLDPIERVRAITDQGFPHGQRFRSGILEIDARKSIGSFSMRPFIFREIAIAITPVSSPSSGPVLRT